MEQDHGQFGGPLGFKDAARAAEEAANEVKATAEKAGSLIGLLIDMLEAFKRRFVFFFPPKK